MALDEATRGWLERRDAEWRAWFERRDLEQKTFLEEFLDHNARITQSMIHALQESTAELVAEIADRREQIRANTQAVLRALDRLGPEPA